MARVDLRSLMNAGEETIGGTDHSPANETKHDQYHTKVTQLDSFESNSLSARKKASKGNSDSSSQILSAVLKSQASIIGLPKPQKTCYVNARNLRCRKIDNIRFFPERTGPFGKSLATLIEPASPQVSCTGRVSSMRDRDRDRRGTNLPASSETNNGEEKSAENHGNGFFDRFISIFQMGRRRQPEEELRNAQVPAVHMGQRRQPEEELRYAQAPAVQWPPRKSKENAAAPSLGSLSRFASGRKSNLL